MCTEKCVWHQKHAECFSELAAVCRQAIVSRGVPTKKLEPALRAANKALCNFANTLVVSVIRSALETQHAAS